MESTQRQRLHQKPINRTGMEIYGEEFSRFWNFPNCLGAPDRKHVVMQAPARSGSSFINYKKTFSIALFAICDARYKYTLVDIGDSVCQSDGSVYNCSHLGYAIENNLLQIPGPAKLPNSEKRLPFVFVADDAFGRKTHSMKPFPSHKLPLDQRVFDYRLSRARRVIGNTFGIAACRFRVLRRPTIANVSKVILITEAIVALHNILMFMDHQGLRLVNGDKTELNLVAFDQFLKVVEITSLRMQLL